MSRSDSFPHSDSELLVWHDRFKANLLSQQQLLELSEEELAVIDIDNSDLHNKIMAANISLAAARQATAEKKASCNTVGNHVKALVRRIKTHPAYNDGIGHLLGISCVADTGVDLSQAKPVLAAMPQSDGAVILKYIKSKSDGINLYSQREDDTEFMFLAYVDAPCYVDMRPLLVTGKPELRRYTAVFVINGVEVSCFSDELVISSHP